MKTISRIFVAVAVLFSVSAAAEPEENSSLPVAVAADEISASASDVSVSAPATEKSAEPAETVAAEPAEKFFNVKNAAILGVVEGLTEYLPISSTGHLIITNSVLGLDSETPILRRVALAEPAASDASGTADSDGIVRDGEGREFSVKDAADAYSIIIQFGAIVAVLFAYWNRCTGTLFGVFRRDAASLRLSRNLIVAFLPAAALGFFIHEKIEEFLFNPGAVAAALVVGGVLMLVVDRRRNRLVRERAGAVSGTAAESVSGTAAESVSGTAGAEECGPDLQDLSVRGALTIGVMQCLALWPGMSRSMSAIVGGYVAGLSPRRATEFSFLLGLITLTAASVYKTLQCAGEMRETFGVGVSAVGLAVAFVCAFASVKWLVEWISRHGLSAFAWYRFALAIVVFTWWTLTK